MDSWLKGIEERKVGGEDGGRRLGCKEKRGVEEVKKEGIGVGVEEILQV